MVTRSCTDRAAGGHETREVGLDVRIAETVALLTAVYSLLRARRPLRQTSLKNGWHWMAAALAVWAGVWLYDRAAGRASDATADFLWYSAAMIMLCPPIYVLGARRPGSRVWSWFVVLPLILVFSFPALVPLLVRKALPVLEIELPMTIAYALVILMGVGNYVGTRFTLAATLYGLALCLLGASVSEIRPAWVSEAAFRGWATILLGTASAVACWAASRPRPARTAFDRLWYDFRDWFGMVWARRVQLRLNETAAAQQWPVHLELDGFALRDGTGDFTAALPPVSAQIEHTFRWLLRRFVEDDWIDARINGGATMSGSPSAQSPGKTTAS